MSAVARLRPAPHDDERRATSEGLHERENSGQHDERILNQLRHDHRTIALLVVVPVVLLTLLYFMFEDAPGVFDRIGLIMLGIFPFVIMFLITSIAMLRERTNGTLERLLTTPMGKLDLLFAYGIAFGVAAAIQASIASGRGVLALRSRHSRRDRLGHLHRDRQRRARRRAWACSAARSPGPSSRRSSSCRSWWSLRSSSVDCSSPVSRWPAGCRRSVTSFR